MLPFNSLMDEPPLQLSGGLEIPKLGSLTLNETLAAQQLAGIEAIAELSGEAPAAADMLIYQLLATILIAFRARADWRLEDTQRLPAEDVFAAAHWFLQERAWWGEAPAPSDGGPPDWGEIYRRLKLDYPAEEWISRESFANTPLRQIQEFLKTAQQREMERLANEGRVVANLAVLMAAANGSKSAKTRHFNDFEAALFVQRAIAEFPPAMAVDLLTLCELGKVPEWVIECVDLEIVRASARTVEDGD